ncbi:hypothetical protein NZNM25_00800 [Nitrosopumilus zosterae]|uniref:Uncharacterized protein n=1 Tax=Nitrosopumilus zosterae TaxID=718286 RepID=A0A2S2KNU0_9ARCH|nr:hypothetical protein [Nitrosopumilus zosterae]BDQ31076.1 hypothetical protein NZOSNM25_001186 [Nitrosopumilus zosterae]GBH33289.1 hypothetical protein NZNM25_00800 [Nitrosopumilus zosterae]
MSEKVWLGAIYLKDEGGYEIIIKSLKHYKNRLKTMGNSPELKNAAAMFASVLNQQAMKTIPVIDETIKKIQDNLSDIQSISKLSEDISFLEKALSCYEADINKAEDTGHEYFVNLVGNMIEARNDRKSIKVALRKIKQFSE